MKKKTLTLDELNKLPKDAIAMMYLQMSESFALLAAQNKTIQEQNEHLIRQTEDLKEQLAILTQHRFGRKTEADKQVLGQLSFSVEDMCVLNEAEALTENNAKYVNAVPFNRLSEEFLRNDVNIPRQDMVGWMIRLSEYYLGPVHDRMKAEIFRSHHVHCDETSFIMPEHNKEYMWVFHSPGGNGTEQGQRRNDVQDGR